MDALSDRNEYLKLMKFLSNCKQITINLKKEDYQEDLLLTLRMSNEMGTTQLTRIVQAPGKLKKTHVYHDNTKLGLFLIYTFLRKYKDKEYACAIYQKCAARIDMNLSLCDRKQKAIEAIFSYINTVDKIFDDIMIEDMAKNN